MKARLLLFVIVLGLCIGLAVFIGQQLSGQGMAAIFGVVLGALASVPTALLAVRVAARALSLGRPPRARRAPPSPAPPIVVVSPTTLMDNTYPIPQPPPSRPRGRYIVIGGEE
jgi:hypothetical protein